MFQSKFYICCVLVCNIDLDICVLQLNSIKLKKKKVVSAKRVLHISVRTLFGRTMLAVTLEEADRCSMGAPGGPEPQNHWDITHTDAA